MLRGETFVTAALAEAGVNDVFAPRRASDAPTALAGASTAKVAVPAAHVADALLVPAATADGVGVFLVERTAAGVALEVGPTTDRSLVANITFDGAAAEPLGDGGAGERVLGWIVDRALLGLAALQVGVCEAAVAMAAEYTSGRQQFGRPLSTFQGAQLKAADGYIGTEAIRVTTLQAAWKLDAGRDASSDVMVAKWWASEAGQQVVHIAQHLHGGMGADIDYPVHRYFLWGKQIEDTLGGASAQLARLGRNVRGSEVR